MNKLWGHALLAAPLLALMLAKPLVLLSLVAKFLLLNQVGKRLLFTAPPQPQSAGTGPRSCTDPPAVPLPTEGVNKPVQAPSPSCSHVESQQDDAMLLAPPSSSPFASCPVLLSNLAQQKLFIDSLKSLYKNCSFSHLFGYLNGFVAINRPKTA